jgi:hypothetical protein
MGPRQLPIPWVPGPFPGVKRPERDVDHSPPSRAQIKTVWSYTSAHPIRLHDVNRNNITDTYFLYCDTAVCKLHFCQLVCRCTIPTKAVSARYRSGLWLCRISLLIHTIKVSGTVFTSVPTQLSVTCT